MLNTPKITQRIFAIYGCLHLNSSWNNEYSPSQAKNAKLDDENTQSKQYHESRKKMIASTT